MDNKTLNAIRGSIMKWSKIVHLGARDVGSEDCPLCRMFPGCIKCPINGIRQDGCESTPYKEWEDHHYYHHRFFVRIIRCPECRETAQAELMFLQDLLERCKNKELYYERRNINGRK